MFDPVEVFEGNNGEMTKAFYAFMDGHGLQGRLATALFRAQKRSSAAKRYKGAKYRHAAYDVKNWSLGEVCRIAAIIPDLVWGWKRDPHTPGYEWVLYVDLPTGQASFHSAERISSQDYSGEWRPIPPSETSILRYCAGIIIDTRTKKEEESPCVSSVSN